MLKLISAFFLLSYSFCLKAQEFHSDSVRPGIKTVTIKMCGYSGNGDSTGLDRFAYKEFDAKGRIKKKIEMPIMLVETQVLPGEEPEMSSWYFESQYYSPKVFDTTWYKYNTAGQISETRWNSYDYGKGRFVRTYDAKGRCIKEQSYSKGLPTTWTKYVYDTKGLKVAVINGDSKKETSTEKMVYDSNGRLTLRLNNYGSNRTDSLVISYGDHVVNKQLFGRYAYETTTFYTEYDSVLKYYTSRISWNNVKVTDTVEFLRDSITHKVVRVNEKYNYGKYQKTFTYDDQGRLIVEARFSGETRLIHKYIRDSTGRILRKEHYINDDLDYYETYSCNERGDIAEYRKYSGSDRLVHREVYLYIYK